jgi:Xaa-Pro aminopeptidase
MSQFLYFYSYSDSGLSSPIDVFLFSSPDRSRETLTATPPFIFENAGFSALRGFEQARVRANDRALQLNELAANAAVSLKRAMSHLGLSKGRIGIDHETIRIAVGDLSDSVSFISAERTMRRIRLIKSSREIALMRLAATLNADAAIAAVRSIRPGASHRELRSMYGVECAKRGLTPVMMQIDTILAETSAERLVAGTAFAIDCLSQGAGYHGDYGRTVFVGEPTKQMKRVTDAIAIGWDAVREQLRPGIRYSDIKRVGVEALRKSGFTLDVAFTPHSVGLSHTDEPGVLQEAGYFVKDDLILQENMIISVDLPVRQSGMGGSAHLEDLSLITRTGSEQINDISNRTLII